VPTRTSNLVPTLCSPLPLGNDVVPFPPVVRSPSGLIIETRRKINEEVENMKDDSLTIHVTLAILLASLVALELEHGVLALIVFVLALTPLPLEAARWLRGKLTSVRSAS
jgi:hypothetical protein